MEERIGLVETIEALRSELREAVASARGQDVQFPVGSVDLEFQVGVTREAHGGGKLRFWVLELGAEGGYDRESLQKLTIHLEAPVDAEGEPIKVNRRSGYRP